MNAILDAAHRFLTGMLDDGVAGLMAIKLRGGVAIAQDPKEAVFASMPSAAIRRVEIDAVAPVQSIGKVIAEFNENDDLRKERALDNRTKEWVDDEIALGNPVPPLADASDMPGQLTMYTCPECHGSLWELQENGMLRYRCHVGHSFTEESFVAEKSDELEAAMWSALRALQEHALMLKRMAEHSQARGHTHAAKQFADRYQEAEVRIKTVRDALVTRSPHVDMPPDAKRAG